MRGVSFSAAIAGLTVVFATTAQAGPSTPLISRALSTIHLTPPTLNYPVALPRMALTSTPMTLPVVMPGVGASPLPGTSLTGVPPIYSPYAMGYSAMSPYAAGYYLRPQITMPPPAYSFNPYMIPPPPQNNSNPMMMMLPMMMGMMGGGGGMGMGRPNPYQPPNNSYSGAPNYSGSPGYSGAPDDSVGGSSPRSTSGSRYGNSRNNEPGVGADTSQVNTSDLSTTYCGRNSGNDFQCMVCNCYFESGNEPFLGKVEVDRVVITRKKNVRDYHENSLCGVIWQRKQFSWTLLYPGRLKMTDARTTKQCMVAAKEAIVKGADGWDHYHASNVRPRWKYGMRFEQKIGSQLFYSQDSLSYADSPGGTSGNVASTAP